MKTTNYFCQTTLLLFTFIIGSVTAEENKDSGELSSDAVEDLRVIFGEKTDEQKSAAVEYAQWSEKLNQHLTNSSDTFSQAMTLASMVTAVQNSTLLAKINYNESLEQQLKDLSYQPIADALNLMITHKGLSSEALDILSSTCFYDKLKDYCYASALLKQRMEQDSENLRVYVRPFEIATQAKNQQAMTNLISLMASSKHSTTVLTITSEMESLIDEFLSENPVPQSTIDSMIADYNQLSGISEKTKNQLEQLMPNYMPAFIKYKYIYLNELPPYKPVLEYCRSNIKTVIHCRKIAQIMIQKSNSMIDKGIGHAILIGTYELERDVLGVQAAKKLNDDFKSSYECIQKLASGPHFIDNQFDEGFQRITLEATDEFEMIIQHAEHRYKKLNANHDKSAINPQDCFE